MKVNIVEKGTIKVVGMAIHTLLQNAGSTGPAIHARFVERKDEVINSINPSLDYGVSIDPPNYNDETDEFKLMIGVEVDNFENVPHGMESLELPATKYACVNKTDDSTFGFLYHWVNESDYVLADTYSIELYDNSNGSKILMFPIQIK
jgi:predicted transcriptional regulator YdeE